MSKHVEAGQRPAMSSSTGTPVLATVHKEQRRDVVVRATERVKSSRAVDATKVDHR